MAGDDRAPAALRAAADQAAEMLAELRAERDRRESEYQELLQSFGLNVIAEGIENQAQVTRLRELGCSMGQGFHLSLPLSGDAIAALVRGERVDRDAVARAESAPP